jgi:hypothetical protein
MKKSAYGKPILISPSNQPIELEKIEAIDELHIQNLIFAHPSILPISEIDESYNPLIPVCKELGTPVGPLDILLVSPDGEICIVETKLWRNPEARRKVVAQILDYAKELSNWTYEDLQREINKKLNSKGNTLYNIVKNHDQDLITSESDFVDAVSRNLRRGKFLLLIAGDGIKENASGIAEFLSTSAYLNFTLAMIELNIYAGKGIGQLIIPHTIVKTTEISKMTINIHEGLKLIIDDDYDNSPDVNSKEVSSEKEFYINFWDEFVKELNFDDPGQPLPNPGKAQNIYVYPGSSKKAWISAYFMKSSKRAGVYFRTANDNEGKTILNYLDSFTEDIREELGEEVIWNWEDNGGIAVRFNCENIFDPSYRDDLKEFFQIWLNKFVNVFRPRLRKMKTDN